MSERQYRICRCEAPHVEDWWTVEVSHEKKRLFRQSLTKWTPARRLIYFGISIGPVYNDIRFDSREEATAWIEEDRKPVVHECEAVP